MGAFIELYESAIKNELILINGGICQWHLRRDKRITIHSIISTRAGAGSEMFEMLLKIAKTKGVLAIFAKCPSDLPSNNWYKKKKFKIVKVEKTRTTNRDINVWCYNLKQGFFK